MIPNVRPDTYADEGLGGSAEPVAPPLLPCPFCGGAAHIESAVDDPGEWFVGCQGCNAILGPVFEDSPCADEDTPAPRVMLTNAWNRRALARAPQGDPPEQTSESYGSVAGMLAHARRVAAELRRLHPAPTDGSEDSVEGEATHVIRRLTKLLTAAPVRTGRMDLHDELDRRFPIYDDFAAFVRGVPAPQGDAAPDMYANILSAVEGRQLVMAMLEGCAMHRHQASPRCGICVERAIETARGGASSSGSAPAGSPPHDPPQEYHWCETCQEKTVHHLSRPQFVCSRAKEVHHPSGAAPAPPPPNESALRAAAFEVWKQESVGSYAWTVLGKALRASAPTPEPDDDTVEAIRSDEAVRDAFVDCYTLQGIISENGMNASPGMIADWDRVESALIRAILGRVRGGASSSGSAPPCPECQTRTGQHLVACGYRNDPRYQAASSGSAPPNPGDRT